MGRRGGLPVPWKVGRREALPAAEKEVEGGRRGWGSRPAAWFGAQLGPAAEIHEERGDGGIHGKRGGDDGSNRGRRRGEKRDGGKRSFT